MHLARLFAHLAWADDRALGALRAAPSPAQAWIELLAHVLGSEHVWLARLHERPAEVAIWPTLTLDGCAELAMANRLGYDTFLAELTPRALGRGVSYRNSAGQAFMSTVEDILLHVAMHGSYHRGQIAAAMRRGGAEPAPTDYIAFVRGAPAATRADR